MVNSTTSHAPLHASRHALHETKLKPRTSSHLRTLTPYRLIETPKLDSLLEPETRLSGRQDGKECEKIYSGLCVNIYRYAADAFGGGHLADKDSAWHRAQYSLFYDLVEQVACDDPCADHWAGLVCDEDERVFLVQAVIMKYIDLAVLSHLCFGCSKDHARHLEQVDSQSVDISAFNRANLRKFENMDYLKRHGGSPPEFWEQVDGAATQIATALLPLYNAVAEAVPRDDAGHFARFYQGLHSLVADAAVLSLRTRLSDDIVRLDWARPGDQRETKYEDVLREAYERSAANAEACDGERAGDTPVMRQARVKISVFPGVALFTRAGDMGEDEAGKVCKHEVLKPHALYYSGLLSLREEAMSHVKLERMTIARGDRPDWWVLVALITAILLGIGLACNVSAPMCYQWLDMLEQGVASLYPSS